MNNLYIEAGWQDTALIIVLIAAAIYSIYLGAIFLAKHFKDDE